MPPPMLVRLALIMSLVLQPSLPLPVRSVFAFGGLAPSACPVGHAASDAPGCCAGLILPDGSSPCAVLDACPCADDPAWPPEPACPARAGTSENTRVAALAVPRIAVPGRELPAAGHPAVRSPSPYRALGHNRARALVCCWTT